MSNFWNAYPFVRLSLALIIGIILYDYFSWLWEFPLYNLLIGSGIHLILLVISIKTGFYRLRHAFGVAVMVIIMYIGGYAVKIHDNTLDNNHYTYVTGFIQGYSGVVFSPAYEKSKYSRYNFKVQHILIQDSLIQRTGEIYLYIRKDSSSHIIYEYGDELLIAGRFYPPKKPSNPNGFDYKTYLSRQNIYAQSFIGQDKIKKIGSQSLNPLVSWVYQLRDKAEEIIDRNITADRENGILKALLLGIKDDLDEEVIQSYAAGGVMHVLAVSGLHVGIIYLFLKVLFGIAVQFTVYYKKIIFSVFSRFKLKKFND